MKFKIKNKIDFPVEVIESHMFSERYYEFLKETHSGVDDIEIVEQADDGNVINRVVKYMPKPIIKQVGPKKVPREAMAFTEHSSYLKDTHTLKFRNVPRIDWVRRRLTNEGTIKFIGSDGKTLRVVEGELKVHFPILGRIAERIIFTQAKKLLEEEVECFKKYLEIAEKDRIEDGR